MAGRADCTESTDERLGSVKSVKSVAGTVWLILDDFARLWRILAGKIFLNANIQLLVVLQDEHPLTPWYTLIRRNTPSMFFMRSERRGKQVQRQHPDKLTHLRADAPARQELELQTAQVVDFPHLATGKRLRIRLGLRARPGGRRATALAVAERLEVPSHSPHDVMQ
jgi:hypothetical protein